MARIFNAETDKIHRKDACEKMLNRLLYKKQEIQWFPAPVLLILSIHFKGELRQYPVQPVPQPLPLLHRRHPPEDWG